MNHHLTGVLLLALIICLENHANDNHECAGNHEDECVYVPKEYLCWLVSGCGVEAILAKIV